MRTGRALHRRASAALTALLLVGASVGLTAIVPGRSLAQTVPDRSEIVLVLDFSASILDDAAIRGRFATALERIADRIDATSADLVAGDATVTIVQFATKAADDAGCVNLRLLDDPDAVARFANCVRDVAAAYRHGRSADLDRRIGNDTNYVAAMERAAGHLASDAVRPALILFTDGKHDVPGVPVGQVAPTRERLFGSRTPFALLPVGMGLDPKERTALEKGLVNLRIIRGIPTCGSGEPFAWPQVVFDSPDEAGNAVAVALQDVSCTFTVAPTTSPTPAPTPTPQPTPGPVRSIRLTPHDGSIELSWQAPAVAPFPIVEYRVRCRTGEADWVEADHAPSPTVAVLDGLTNGATYECAVAAVDATSAGDWTPALATVVPLGLPAAPAKPVVEALDGAVRVHLPAEPDAQVTSYRYECSSDQGQTWPYRIDVPSTGLTTADVPNLPNGIDYVCRGYTLNAAGTSDASETSDAARLCGAFLDCNPVGRPVLVVVGVLALLGVLLTLLTLYRRTRGYVVAVVDFVHTANLGRGTRFGIAFVRASEGGPVTGIEADRSRTAELRVRWMRGDRFEVTDRAGRHVANAGETVVVVDALGARHQVVLRGFRTATASPLATGR